MNYLSLNVQMEIQKGALLLLLFAVGVVAVDGTIEYQWKSLRKSICKHIS